MKNLILLLVAITFAIGCSKENSNALEYQIGKNEFNIEVDDTLRNFLIHVPTNYTGDEAVPVVFMLHGSSGSGTKFYNISSWVQKSEEVGCIVVFPTGLEYPIVEKNNKMSTKWSSDGLVNDIPEGYPIKDDVPFINGLIDLCDATFNIDKNRLYITGFSNGGAFVRTRVIQEMNDVFAAANCSGGYGLPEVDVVSGRLLPIFAIIGSRDKNIIGNTETPEEIPLKAEEILDHELYGLYLKNMLTTLELDANNYTETSNPPKYNLITFTPKDENEENFYQLMIVNDMGHNYPNGSNNPQGVVAANHLWEWFMNYSL